MLESFSLGDFVTRSSLSRPAFAAIAAFTVLTVATRSLAAQGAPPAQPSAPPTAPPTAPITTPPTAGAAAAAPVAPAAPVYLASHAEAVAVGRATVQAALTGLVDSLVATADPANGAAADVRTRVTDGLAQISSQLGAERRMVAERVMLVDGKIEYWRTSEYERVPVPLVLRVTLGVKGTWRGVAATTEDETPAGEEVKP